MIKKGLIEDSLDFSEKQSEAYTLNLRIPIFISFFAKYFNAPQTMIFFPHITMVSSCVCLEK